VAGGRAHCVLGTLPVVEGANHADGEVDVMLRPEQIEVLPESAAREGTHEALVREITFQGQDAALTLQLLDTPTTVRARVPGYRTPRQGDRVRLAVGGEVSVYPR
jgi:iron(III) transport system ATP-binding protein